MWTQIASLQPVHEAKMASLAAHPEMKPMHEKKMATGTMVLVALTQRWLPVPSHLLSAAQKYRLSEEIHQQDQQQRVHCAAQG